ncbi:MAG: 50S ribosomal protein L9 [Candidatus Omnitrophica bacterium]|nr:50S ribosomal protein L9 [Candidatus Omnitrophota bacterium]
MKVILRKDVDNIGKCGQVISVKDGFARNFLLPKGLALAATNDGIKQIEIEKKKTEHNKKIEKSKAEELSEKLKGLSVTISAEAKDDVLYGSVTSADIAQALKEEDIEIEKQNILLEQPLKNLGIYEIEVRLHPEVNTKIKVWVVKK